MIGEELTYSVHLMSFFRHLLCRRYSGAKAMQQARITHPLNTTGSEETRPCVETNHIGASASCRRGM